ncbi:MAG: RNA polymerase factor sigma-54 [Muribaculaceae bacterium]|nr:RNA polymerase factor sigma-54 [Muribaculaceae bacterium]
MKENLSLNTTLRQQQRLTPLQVKYVRMLEMNAPEIEDEVRRAVDEMPALEAKDEDAPISPESNADSAQDDQTPYYRYAVNNRSASDPYYDVVASAGDHQQTLLETLAEQIGVSDLDDRQRRIALQIIGNLDDNGYITRDLQSIALDVNMADGLDVTPAEVNEVWQKIRTFDPAGVGAVDLRDCLALQLKRMTPTEAVDDAAEIVNHYFDLFSRKQFDRLRAAADLDRERLRNAMDVIRRLNPKPGAAFASGAPGDDSARHVVPDFAVEADGDRLILTSLSRIPDLGIEKSFEADTPITPRAAREGAKMFIRTKRNEAQEFIRIIRMRQETLYRVMQAILKIQRDFFLTGDERDIRPMILKDVAALTGYDLSVISRATTDKYVATSHGIYPLKMLFNERPREDSDASSVQIQHALRDLIDAEDKSAPLSDEALTAALAARGFDIARRTVAKYRERLGLPVARLRKEMK